MLTLMGVWSFEGGLKEAAALCKQNHWLLLDTPIHVVCVVIHTGYLSRLLLFGSSVLKVSLLHYTIGCLKSNQCRTSIIPPPPPSIPPTPPSSYPLYPSSLLLPLSLLPPPPLYPPSLLLPSIPPPSSYPLSLIPPPPLYPSSLLLPSIPHPSSSPLSLLPPTPLLSLLSPPPPPSPLAFSSWSMKTMSKPLKL